MRGGASQAALVVKNLPANAGDVPETQVPSLCQEDPLEEGMATHSSILAWRIRGQRSLVGCSPWVLTELDTTEAFRPLQLLSPGKIKCTFLEVRRGLHRHEGDDRKAETSGWNLRRDIQGYPTD